jgi:hypothetical protein
MAGYARHRRAGEPACGPCLAATREDSARLHRRDPEHSRALARARMTKFRSGITLPEYELLLSAQGGVCALCGSDDPRGTGRFVIDHDHGCCPGKRSCGACIRGLLCHPCNSAIGLFGEDVVVLTAAIDYLGSR